jgi:acylphosphatase
MKKRIECGMAGKSIRFDYLLWAKNLAERYGLTGVAFIKEDGSIKVIAEGDEPSLSKLADKLSRGHLWHDIENFYIDWSSASEEFQDFRVIEGEEAAKFADIL